MTYIENGYIETGHFETDKAPIVPSDKIITIEAKIEIVDNNNSVVSDLTQNVVHCDIDIKNGSFYNVLDLKLADYQIDKQYIRNKDYMVRVTIDDDVYNFIIMDCDYTHNNTVFILGNGQGVLIKEPFVTDTVKIITGSANEIMTELTKDISRLVQTKDFSFNKGSFISTGKPIDDIRNLVNVSGGTFFEQNNTLILRDCLSVSSTFSMDIQDDILLKKVISDNFKGSALINKVTFNSDMLSDIKSDPLITMVTESDFCTRPYFLLNPTPISKNQIYSNLGTITFVNKQQTFDEAVVDTKVINVSGGISSIIRVMLGGVEVDSSRYMYKNGFNVVLFDGDVTGQVQIIYITKAIVRYTNNGERDEETGNNLYKLRYYDQELLKIYGCMDGYSGASSVDDRIDCSVNLISNMGKDVPLYFDIVGTIQSISVVSDPMANPTTRNGVKCYGTFDSTFLDNIETKTGARVDSFEERMDDMSSNTGIMDGCFGFVLSKSIALTNALINNQQVSLYRYDKNEEFDVYYVTDRSYLGNRIMLSHNIATTRKMIPTAGWNTTAKYIEFFVCGKSHRYKYPTGGQPIVSVLPTYITFDLVSSKMMTGFEFSNWTNRAYKTIQSQVAVYIDGTYNKSYDLGSDGKVTIPINDQGIYKMVLSPLGTAPMKTVTFDFTKAQNLTDYKTGLNLPIIG